MNKEDKELLLKDLSARLMYNVMLHIMYYDLQGSGNLDERDVELTYGNICYCIQKSHWVDFKPYLRPLSSMTEDEKIQLRGAHLKDESLFSKCLIKAKGGDDSMRGKVITHFAADWCNKNHFDYRGLIEKGLAIEVTKENNPYGN